MIGCGAISAAHIDSIVRLPNAKLVAAYNRTRPKAEAVAQKHGCTAYDDLDALLAREDVEIVTICTASGAHLEPALKAAAAGKHVIIEKPLEITPQRCDQIIAACERSGVKLATVFQSRFSPHNRALKAAIDAGRLGRLVLGDAYVKWFRSQAYYDNGAWRGTWEVDGGGALMNQAIHQIDLLQWMMGDVESVYGQTGTLAHERIDVEDTAAAVIRFASGALGVIEGTTSIYGGYPKRIEIHGSQGTAVLVDDEPERWELAGMTEEERSAVLGSAVRDPNAKTFADPMAMSFDKHRAQLQDFIAAIEEDRSPAVDGREGRKSVEIIRAIYRSAKTGQAVKLPLQDD